MIWRRYFTMPLNWRVVSSWSESRLTTGSEFQIQVYQFEG